MNLTTLLNIKKLLRAVLFYNHWPPKLKSGLKSASALAKLRLLMARRRMRLSVENGKACFSCGGRTVIVPAQEAENPEYGFQIASQFNRFFDPAFVRCEDGTLDLTGEISLCGFRVRTNAGMVLEVESLLGYNKYYSPKQGDVVFDCGAFHGIYALLISVQVGNHGRIFCFEPDSANAEILLWNLKRNKIKNVVLVKKGVWDKSGRVGFNPGQGAVSSVAFGAGSGAGHTIDVVSIPEFLSEQGMDRLDLVKMDIEGAEIEVVQGCLDFIRSHPVNFAVASYHLRDGTETFHLVERLFRSAGYEVQTEVTETITTYAWQGKAKA